MIQLQKSIEIPSMSLYEIDDGKPMLSATTDSALKLLLNPSIITSKRKYFSIFGGFIFNLVIGGTMNLLTKRHLIVIEMSLN